MARLRDFVGALQETGEWLQRASSVLPLRDGLALFNPPVQVGWIAKYALAGRHKRDIPSDDPAQRDPELVGLVFDAVRVLGRHYFRLEIDGVENLPAHGPVLLVGNHNGGFVPTDSFFTGLAVWDRFGPSRALYALGHDFLFYDLTLRRFALRLGVLRAGHDSARRAFALGGMVLVYPGSDLDTFRPWRERSRVVLGGRKGFLQLALSSGVPIVPVVSAGTQEQFIVLTRGDGLARRLQLHRWLRTTVCPIVLSVPWGITSGFLPYLPVPAQTSLAFGAPITWPGLSARDADAPAVLDRCYAEVEATMQSMLDRLVEGRRPFLGAPRHDHRIQPSKRPALRSTIH